MIRGFCRAHDDNPTLFKFLLFVQHGQLAKLEPGTPTPVDVMRDVLDKAIASREIPAQTARSGDRAGVRRRTAAGHVRRIRTAADSLSDRCASV